MSSGGDSSRAGSGANPFHQASLRLQHTTQNPVATSATATHGPTVTRNNPFLSQLARSEKTVASTKPTPFGEHFATKPAPAWQPLYAAVAMGVGRGRTPGPVPSFITHGPGSISLGVQEEGMM